MVSIPAEEKLNQDRDEAMIIFVGKMSYEPNIVAVNYFAKSVFPSLREVIGGLRFVIVGANPDKRVMKLSQIEGVEITGFVDSVEPYLQKCTMVVAPMLTGAGIQNKIIQAMAYGCCVATSPIGAEGLNVTTEIAIFNSTREWIDGMTGLLHDKRQRALMGHDARDYVVNNLSKEVVAAQFGEFISAADK